MSSIHNKITKNVEVEDESKEYESECWEVLVTEDTLKILLYRREPTIEAADFNKWKALMRKVATCKVNKVRLIGSVYRSKSTFNTQYVPLFCDAIKSNTVVTALEVWSSAIDVNGMKGICGVLQTHATITDVCLSRVSRDSIVGADLEKLITVNSIIKTLKVDVTAEEVMFIARALPHNSTLTELAFWGRYSHQMGNKGLRILCEGLKRNHSITSLDLGYNDISKDGTKYLCSLLAVNHSITSVNLCGNDIVALPNDFAFLSHINTLDLTCNSNIRFPPRHIAYSQTEVFEFFATFRYGRMKFHFLLGFQERVGRHSSIHSYFYGSTIFEPNLLGCIFEFLP